MRVEVYWNMHKKLWSVRAMEGPDKGRVIEHASSLTLSDCSYVVQPAGKAKVRAEGKKYVHAFVRGFWHNESVLITGYAHFITYNPYRDDTFVTQDENRRPIERSNQAYLTKVPNTDKPACLGFDVTFMKEAAC